ncbi:CD209 antigen-like protein E isoform X2 [Thamnophis elegans]|uniref:CD209 antigen-like protein E isoform X2 n=1 Tax=Thamnophis elegans TaxID=35005 RepID=UPI001376B14B|nr:CD209 antigen-like protein E isoform X2 [Thamnophis elegans]
MPGIYMSAGTLASFPVPPKGSPKHLDDDDDDYDDGRVVTISLPLKELEKKEDPSICKPAKENNSRKLHIPILYLLVAISFATWVIFFFLVLKQYSEISEKIQNLTESQRILNLSPNYSEKIANNSVCSQGNSTMVSSCPFGWKHQSKYCYYFSTEKTNWINALLNCINNKAYLVSISSDEEQGFLKNNLNEVDYWLGMSDLEGPWKWKESGMVVETSFWDRGQPSKDANKDCGLMHPNGTWASAVCSDHNRWICKKELIC